jgi:hypothetical protein
MLIFAIADDILIEHIDAVARIEVFIPRLLETSLTYQYYTCSQTNSQTEDLNPVVLTTLIERFDYVHMHYLLMFTLQRYGY